jgi:hypothetical protein
MNRKKKHVCEGCVVLVVPTCTSHIAPIFRGLYTSPHILVDSMYTIRSLQGVYRDFSGTAQGVHGHCL